ncbi:MAG TPA: glycosyltransferase 87 family protein [Candidatus Acidoferrales bacterium]|nr:glycosyltransferase 87 family protein [Candidatus Acidoferrales bacterium]
MPGLATAAVVYSSLVLTVLYRHSRAGLELRDFRDGIYYAVVALLHGDNPYDTPHYLQTYPVEQGYSPYAPGFLSLHFPFGLLPFETAQNAYFIVLCGLGLGLGLIAWRYATREVNLAAALFLATALLLSRPGSWNVGLGQYALQFSIGAALALCIEPQRYRLAGLGCAITLLKPTYGVPLSLLLLSSGRVRIWLVGVAVAVLLSLPPGIAVLKAAGGFIPLLNSLHASFANFSSDTTAGAATGPERVDVIGLVGFGLGYEPSAALEVVLTLGVLACGSLCFHRIVKAAGGQVSPLALVVGCLTILVCTYHQTYDLVLLLVPVTAWAHTLISDDRRRASSVALLLLLLFPMVNYLSPQAVQASLGIRGLASSVLTRANALALTMAFGLALTLTTRTSQASAARSTS